MVPVGVLARFEVKAGNEAKIERFFQEGLAIVQQQKASTVWFAFRLSPSVFGIFDAFSDEGGRRAHFLAGAERAERASHLLAISPVVEKVDILVERKQTGSGWHERPEPVLHTVTNDLDPSKSGQDHTLTPNPLSAPRS